MLITFSIILFSYFRPNHGQFPFPTKAQYLMYGNLINMESRFLPMDGTGVDPNRDIKSNITLEEAMSDSYMTQDFDGLLNEFKTTRKGGADGSQFNELNYQIINITEGTRKRLFVGWKDGWFHDEQSDPMYIYSTGSKIEIEARKIRRLVAICLTFLIHTRYLVDKAFKQRDFIRDDKRYKMGYLFNRLRRIKTEMLKMVRMAYEANNVWWQARVMVTMRLYEEVIHMDMDIRDTMWMITELAEKYEDFDYVDSDVEDTTEKGPKKTKKLKKP